MPLSGPALAQSALVLLAAAALVIAWGHARDARRLRAALAAEQKRIALVLRATQSGIIDWDVAAGRIDYSERFKEMLGFPPHADLSDRERYFDFLHPEDREAAHAAFVEHLRSGGDTLHPPVEYRLLRPDGGITWVSGTGLAVRDPSGRAVRYVASVNDVSERKRHEAEREVQQHRLSAAMALTRDLVNAVSTPFFFKDEKLRFTHLNPAWCEMTGVPLDKAIGGTVHDVFPPESAAIFDRQDRKLLADPAGAVTAEISIPDREGGRYYLITKTPLKRPDGTLRGIVGSLTDITGLKSAEQGVRESEARMRFWLENIPIPVAIYDPEGRVQYVNPQFEATFGWKLEAIRGERMPFVPEPWQPQLKGVLHNLLTIGHDAFESQRLTRDGRVLDVFISTGMARDADGAPRATMVSLIDVTGRKRMERELAASREEALQAAQAKAAFLATMSHEIRTPLNAVLGMSELLADTPLAPQQRELVDTIKVSGDALLSAINDILDYSKIESGRMDLEREPVDVRRAVREGLDIVGLRAREKGLELAAAVADEVPAWIEGDLSRLRQVLVNLLGNAVKFTERGSVRVEAALRGGRLEFSVSDTGVGIARDRVGSLFEAFTQADSSITRKYGGTGLGLAITRRLVLLMGGEISVDSEAGVGSVFRFTVPAVAAAAPQPEVAMAPQTPRGRLRILVADDVETNRRLALGLLAKLGYEADAVASGVEAVERGASGEYDVVLMDIQMPDMDGIEATRRIRERCAGGGPRIVAMTANSLGGDRERCEAAGMDDHLRKPVSGRALGAALERAAPQREGPIDWSRIDSLAPYDEGSLVKSVIDSFLRDAPGQIGLMEAAHRAADATALAAAAHALKGAAANVGATALSEAGARIERAARSGQLDAVEAWVKGLASCLGEAERALRARR